MSSAVEVWTRVSPRNYVLERGPDTQCDGADLNGKRAAIVKLAVCRDLCEKAVPIEMLFGMWTGVGPRKQALDGGSHWRNLANTTEPSMCGGDAAFTLYYFDHLLLLLYAP